MAGSAARRVNSRSEQYSGYAAADSYAIRYRTPARTKAYEGESVSARTKKNRSKALAMNRTFVLFLTLISIATVFMCVQFLRLKWTIRQQLRGNAALETELVTMRAENDALYADIMNSVDLTEIREIAVDRYGMNYATQDQIVWYNTMGNGYVRQYQDVPAG